VSTDGITLSLIGPDTFDFQGEDPSDMGRKPVAVIKYNPPRTAPGKPMAIYISTGAVNASSPMVRLKADPQADRTPTAIGRAWAGFELRSGSDTGR
jgi:hypothetical protein